MSDNGNYEGIENLEVMESAVRYNHFLQSLAYGQFLQSIESASAHGEDDVKKSLSIVDFGAGTGTICIPLRKLIASRQSSSSIEHTVNIICVEPDDRLRGKLTESGFQCYESLSGLQDQSMSLVYSFNVLEHIEDDKSALMDIRRVLAAGGRLLVYVPAFDLLYGAMDRKVGHYRRYRLKSMVSLLEQSGFAVQRAEYVDAIGFFATLVFNLISSGEGNISRKSLIFYDQFVFPVSRILDRVLNRIFGKNLLVEAIKK